MGNCTCQDGPRNTESGLNMKQLLKSSIQSHTNNCAFQIKAMTWNKDSHGLFDYENRNLVTKELRVLHPHYYTQIDGEGHVVREQNLVRFVKTATQPSLMKIILENECYWITPQTKEATSKLEPLWIVVKSAQTTKGVQMDQGDIVKIGRVKLYIRKFNKDAERASQTRGSYSSGVADELMCRLCLSGTETAEDLLINPCSCQGTMEYIHLKCLHGWINTKQSTSLNAISFFWDTMKCELCKTPFLRKFICNGTEYDLVELSEPKHCPFVVIDVKRKFQKETQKSTFILMFDKTPTAKVGRSTDSTLRINDISVSRNHAAIKIAEDGLYITDNNSKFGSLIKFKQKIPILPEMNRIQFQAGRTVLELMTQLNQNPLAYSVMHKLM